MRGRKSWRVPAYSAHDSEWATLASLKEFTLSYGLDISVRWMRSVTSSGSAYYEGQTMRSAKYLYLEFSSTLWPYMSPEERFGVLAHETAHALLPPSAGHGRRWKSLCRKLGGSGDVSPAISHHAIRNALLDVAESEVP